MAKGGKGSGLCPCTRVLLLVLMGAGIKGVVIGVVGAGDVDSAGG